MRHVIIVAASIAGVVPLSTSRKASQPPHTTPPPLVTRQPRQSPCSPSNPVFHVRTSPSVIVPPLPLPLPTPSHFRLDVGTSFSTPASRTTSPCMRLSAQLWERVSACSSIPPTVQPRASVVGVPRAAVRWLRGVLASNGQRSGQRSKRRRWPWTGCRLKGALQGPGWGGGGGGGGGGSVGPWWLFRARFDNNPRLTITLCSRCRPLLSRALVPLHSRPLARPWLG